MDAPEQTARRELALEATYLHARLPADARVVLFASDGPGAVANALPDDLWAQAERCETQILLPTEESTLQPVAATGGEERSRDRIAPALWTLPGSGLSMALAVPWLAQQDPRSCAPGLRLLVLAAKLATTMVERGDFAPAGEGSVLQWTPHWTDSAVQALSSLVELVPGCLTTARLATADDPVYAVTPRNLLVSFVGHAVNETVRDREPGFTTPERLPRAFWRTPPQPVLEILVPERELEEGVPWGLQLQLRPVSEVDLFETLEEVHARLGASLFPDVLAREALEHVEHLLESLADRLPPLRRAKNMADGKVSLNRQELDQILDHLPLLEAEGIEVRLPGVESMQRISARVSLVEEPGHENSPRPWFEFNWSLAVGDQELRREEFEQLITAKAPLVFLKRGPVLLSPKDRDALQAFKKRMKEGGQRVSFFDALRLKLGGASHMHGLAMETLESTPRLDELIACLERARHVEDRTIPGGFIGELRPYQVRGHAWMYYLIDQGFGACLADDMGLGKTVQAIAVMLDWRSIEGRTAPLLIVCPVSVLGNWRRELHRFSPELRTSMHHGKARARNAEDFAAMLGASDVVLTSYNLLQRDEELLSAHEFEAVILDEAQNIKNPSTRQSKAARRLRGNFRLALTGTPLENRPLDLWSIMDFLNEGLLGTRTSFQQTLEHPIIKQRSRSSMSALARLVRPFVLRRLKTDPDIISDLPEKTEQVVAASLTREQAILYESVVRKGLDEVEKAAEGIQRRGAVLTTLLRLKQVCNHPSHYLMDGSSLPSRSGKMELLCEMVEEALEEGDRCLVFTQFKEMGTLLKTHLENVIKQHVLFLHGGVPQKERDDMVAHFQTGTEESPKIFVLSLKAGGTGLNLTSANRVFHYDRWWNPAVEDQATDRAFRIGQQRNVFVHKFVCTGTLEERIQQMLERKREVADNLLAAGEGWITELTNDELRRLLTLDRQEALA